MSPHAVQFREALAGLSLMIQWKHPWMPVTITESGASEDFFHRSDYPGAYRRLIWLVEHIEQTRDATITFGTPHRQRGAGAMGATFLTVRTQGTDQAQRAARLPVLPSMVLREGGSSRRTLLWWLQREVDYFEQAELNRKLAYFCGATQKHGVPEKVSIPAPGSCVRTGKRPAPVVVTRMVAGAFDPAHVVHGLKEPPDPSAWLDSANGGGGRR